VLAEPSTQHLSRATAPLYAKASEAPASAFIIPPTVTRAIHMATEKRSREVLLKSPPTTAAGVTGAS